jgi:hypothetical protein
MNPRGRDAAVLAVRRAVETALKHGDPSIAGLVLTIATRRLPDDVPPPGGGSVATSTRPLLRLVIERRAA